MNTEKVFMIVTAQVNPNGQEALKSYLQASGPIFEKAGGAAVVKYKIESQIVGDQAMSLVSIMEFPSQEILEEVFKSKEYLATLPLRNKAFFKLEVFVGK